MYVPKKRRSFRLIKLALPESLLAFFRKSVILEASIKKKKKKLGESGNGGSQYARLKLAVFLFMTDAFADQCGRPK